MLLVNHGSPSELSLPGDHNLENALAAIVASKLRGAENEAIVEVLTSFAGVKFSSFICFL